MSFMTFEMLLVTKRSIFMTLGAQSAPPGKIGLNEVLRKIQLLYSRTYCCMLLFSEV